MILTINKASMISTGTIPSIIKTGTNATIGFISANLLDTKGILLIKGSGQIIGASNPLNTISETISLVVLNPLINQVTRTLFTKTFINSGLFFFEIQIGVNTAIHNSKFEFSDNSIIINNLAFSLNTTGSVQFGLEHTIGSGLYQIQIDNVYSEYKVIMP